MIFRTISLFLVSLLITLSSYGHEVRPSYLELVQQNEDSYAVLWKVPAKGDLRLGLDVIFDESVENITHPVERFSAGSYTKRWRIRQANALVNTSIYIEGLDSTLTEALVRIEHLDGSVQISRLMPDNPSVLVEATPTATQVAKTYTALGIKHIWAGIDHLLFLVCLLLIAGTGKRILITITGFTAAHSITLVLSALNIVHVNIAAVEAIIALSIVFLAIEIAKGKRNSLTWQYPISVSTSFGLLHGFGFAAVLNEIGLPQTELAVGLLFFNAGVEIGQILFVTGIILLVRVLILVKINLLAPLLHKPVAYSIGSLASFWLIERSTVFLF